MKTVLDLYCGTGTIAICLAAQAAEVIGLELVESAVVDAHKNCRTNGIENCRFILGDIKDTLKTVSVAPDLLVIDPPPCRYAQGRGAASAQIGAGKNCLCFLQPGHNGQGSFRA